MRHTLLWLVLGFGSGCAVRRGAENAELSAEKTKHLKT